jgi:Zn-finger nucleic acid-binding protein
MRTYERNGVTVEQCDSCRGIFLDFGELESLTRLEAQMAGPPPQQQQAYPQQYPPQPGWGGHGYEQGYGHRRRRGFGGLFFSS